ncbi:MAG: XRE family transcriptional regulator [Candidatus Roizmanbacteria bacterium]|nr:XRE family transcriptional regulator [Candidatus Roizmanbacteria bacterium]
MSILSENIKIVRKEILGLSQSDFANLVKAKTPTAVSHWESGRSEPDSATLVRIAELGRKPLDWLLAGRKRVLVYLDDLDKGERIPFIEYAVLAQVPAGNNEFHQNDWPEYEKIDYDPNCHFWLIIDAEYGYSMTPFLQPGDMVLCSSTAKILDGDIVAVRWDKTKGAVKIWTETLDIPNAVTLTPYNNAEKPIMLSKKRIEQKFKVLLIKKKK